MILKVKNIEESTITVIQVSVIEYNYDTGEMNVWDASDNLAVIVPDFLTRLDDVVSDLCNRRFAEFDGRVDWRQ